MRLAEEEEGASLRCLGQKSTREAQASLSWLHVGLGRRFVRIRTVNPSLGLRLFVCPHPVSGLAALSQARLRAAQSSTRFKSSA